MRSGSRGRGRARGTMVGPSSRKRSPPAPPEPSRFGTSCCLSAIASGAFTSGSGRASASLLVEKKRIETIAKLEGAWKVSGRRSLEPGQQTRFDVTIVNRGRNTWPAGYEDWSIEGIADVPGALTDESDQTYLAFSFRSRPLGRRDIGPGERLYWTHDVDPVPQYDGAFNMDFVLYKGPPAV